MGREHESAAASESWIRCKAISRFSETFIVNELLAHEESGMELEIFSLRPPCDTHFQDLISRVRAPLTYLSDGQVKAELFWSAMQKAAHSIPEFYTRLSKIDQSCTLDVYCGIRLATEVVRRKITHLHAHFATSPATVASIAAKLAGITYSFTAHAKDIYHEDVSMLDLVKKMAESSTTITVSDFNHAYLMEQASNLSSRLGGVADVDWSSKIVRLYNGIHLDQFPFHADQNRSRTIIAVGRFVEKKGFDVLIDACAILRDRGVEFRCQLVGGGELEGTLKQQIENLRLGEHIEMVGPQPQKVVKEMVAQAAVMAAPCILGNDGNRDGMPTVLLESFALGTPCISTDVTGIPELIQHRESGMIVPQHDAIALADALQECLDDQSLRESLANRARQKIELEYDIRNNSRIQRDLFLASHNSQAIVAKTESPAACLAGV